MTALSTATEATKVEFAAQMVIMDAIEKGHTDRDDLLSYMESETFEKAVNGYLSNM